MWQNVSLYARTFIYWAAAYIGGCVYVSPPQQQYHLISPFLKIGLIARFCMSMNSNRQELRRNMLTQILSRERATRAHTNACGTHLHAAHTDTPANTRKPNIYVYYSQQKKRATFDAMLNENCVLTNMRQIYCMQISQSFWLVLLLASFSPLFHL